jgi:hypothetical protein
MARRYDGKHHKNLVLSNFGVSDMEGGGIQYKQGCNKRGGLFDKGTSASSMDLRGP